MNNEELIVLTAAKYREIENTIALVRRLVTEQVGDTRFESPSTYFVNKSGQEIPAYGVFQVDGIEKIGGVNHLKAVRYYDNTAARTTMCFNGHTAVKDGDYGTIQNGPVYRAVTDGAITYAAGDRLGWKVSSFELQLGALLVCLGDDDITDDCVRVMFDYSTMVGEVEDDIEDGQIGVVHRYREGSSGWSVETDKDYMGINLFGGTIEAGTKVKMWPTEGMWSIVEICQ